MSYQHRHVEAIETYSGGAFARRCTRCLVVWALLNCAECKGEGDSEHRRALDRLRALLVEGERGMTAEADSINRGAAQGAA
jgi:hypothetical protein